MPPKAKKTAAAAPSAPTRNQPRRAAKKDAAVSERPALVEPKAAAIKEAGAQRKRKRDASKTTGNVQQDDSDEEKDTTDPSSPPRRYVRRMTMNPYYHNYHAREWADRIRRDRPQANPSSSCDSESESSDASSVLEDAEHGRSWVVKFSDVLGQTDQGKVVGAVHPSGRVAAAKYMMTTGLEGRKKMGKADRDYRQIFRQEIRCLSGLRDRRCQNICNYISHVTGPKDTMILFIERASGDLDSLLQDWNYGFYDPRQYADQATWERLSLVLEDAWGDMVEALMYLGSLETPIVHHDVKPANILYLPAPKQCVSSYRSLPTSLQENHGNPLLQIPQFGWTFKLADFDVARPEHAEVDTFGSWATQGPDLHYCDGAPPDNGCDKYPIVQQRASRRTDVYGLMASFIKCFQRDAFTANEERYFDHDNRKNDGNMRCVSRKASGRMLRHGHTDYFEFLMIACREGTPLYKSFVEMLHYDHERRLSIEQVAERTNDLKANWGRWVPPNFGQQRTEADGFFDLDAQSADEEDWVNEDDEEGFIRELEPFSETLSRWGELSQDSDDEEDAEDFMDLDD